MQFLDKDESERWIANSRSDITQCIKQQLNKPSFGFSTWSTGGLDTFNLGRFFWANFTSPSDTLLWITEKGPFSERAEEFLFEKFLLGVDPKHSQEECRTFLFNENNNLEFVSIFSLCVLFSWDFWVINESTPFIFEHSHDVDARIHMSSDEVLNGLHQMGVKNTLRQ